MVPQSQCSYHPVLWTVGTGTQGTETFCLRKWLYMQVSYSSEWFLRVSVLTIQCCGTLEPEPKEPKLFASGSGSTCR